MKKGLLILCWVMGGLFVGLVFFAIAKPFLWHWILCQPPTEDGDTLSSLLTITIALLALGIGSFGWITFTTVRDRLHIETRKEAESLREEIRKEVASFQEKIRQGADRLQEETRQATKEIEKLQDSMGGAYHEVNIALARIYLRDGLDRWIQNNVDRAIELTEKALDFMKKEYPIKPPKTKNEEIIWGFIRGNLAYYYAQSKNQAKYAEALNFSNEALDIGKKYNLLQLIEDYIYVVKEYRVEDGEYYKTAKQLIDIYSDDFINRRIITSKKLKEYEDYYS
ncbi:hypothetical protein ES705_25109 [subsurface metagenome]